MGMVSQLLNKWFHFADSVTEIMDDDDEEESQGQAKSSDVKISEAESATLDDVAPEHSQHPSSPVSTS